MNRWEGKREGWRLGSLSVYLLAWTLPFPCAPRGRLCSSFHPRKDTRLPCGPQGRHRRGGSCRTRSLGRSCQTTPSLPGGDEGENGARSIALEHLASSSHEKAAAGPDRSARPELRHVAAAGKQTNRASARAW